MSGKMKSMGVDNGSEEREAVNGLEDESVREMSNGTTTQAKRP